MGPSAYKGIDMENIEGKLYDILLGMYKEMVISNQPEHLKKQQRELFETVDSIRHFTDLIEMCEDKNQPEKAQRYVEWRNKYEERYETLIGFGCVDIEI